MVKQLLALGVVSHLFDRLISRIELFLRIVGIYLRVAVSCWEILKQWLE